jgi:hypothetical protein
LFQRIGDFARGFKACCVTFPIGAIIDNHRGAISNVNLAAAFNNLPTVTSRVRICRED